MARGNGPATNLARIYSTVARGPVTMALEVCESCGERWERTGERPAGSFVDCPACESPVRITDVNPP